MTQLPPELESAIEPPKIGYLSAISFISRNGLKQHGCTIKAKAEKA